MNTFNSSSRRQAIRRWWVRVAVASLWLYEGLWCKILGGAPHQERVASAITGVGGLPAESALRAIGLLECAIAVWVLSGRRARASSVTQTILLAAMNAAGLIWGRPFIPDPGAMVVQNLAFLTLVWHAVYL